MTARTMHVYTGDSTRMNVSIENYVKVNDALACDLQCQALKTEFAENVRSFLLSSVPRRYCVSSYQNDVSRLTVLVHAFGGTRRR